MSGSIEHVDGKGVFLSEFFADISDLFWFSVDSPNSSHFEPNESFEFLELTFNKVQNLYN